MAKIKLDIADAEAVLGLGSCSPRAIGEWSCENSAALNRGRFASD
jgi:hypothetical protein